MSHNKRNLHFNLFLGGAGHHPAAWRHPSVDPSRLFELDYYGELARLAESAKLDALYVNDRLANRTQQPYAVVGHFETFTLLAALSVRTRNIGLIASASSIYNQPYHVARKLASLDYASHGRAGWTIVPSRGDDEAHNYGLDEAPSRAVRDQRTREFVDLAKKLWDSWEDGAVTFDEVNGLKTYPDKVRPVNHRGAHFSVEGPLNVPRPVQGHPVLAQEAAGSGEELESFGALDHAELIFTSHHHLSDATNYYSEVRRRVARLGRNPEDVRIFTSVGFILGETEAEARALEAELDGLLAPQQGLARLSQLLKIDLSEHPLDSPLPPLPSDASEAAARGPWLEVSQLARRDDVTLRDLIRRITAARRHPQFVGTPAQLADHLENWFKSGAADGFNLRPALLPLGLEQFRAQVVPELQRRGLFREDYEGRTLRSHYGLPRPENQFAKAAAEKLAA